MKKFMRFSLLLVLPLMAAATVVWKVAANDPVDPVEHTVLLPDPTSCEHYYSCSNGVAIRMKCPDGQHFNAKLSVCDWPQNAECKEPKQVVCYWESKVRTGYTYYDCGSCKKVYDEEGRGKASKCTTTDY
jgi:hypothetical protein